MTTLRTVLFIIFIADSLLLVIAVLLQSGRGGGLAGALGGISGADSALGVRAASQIEKATGVLAVIFLAVALALGFMPHGKVTPPDEAKVGTRQTTVPAGAGQTSGQAGRTTSPGTTSGAAESGPSSAPADTGP